MNIYNNFIFLKKYMKSLLINLYNEIGIFEKPNDDPHLYILRAHLINTACEVRIQKCLIETAQTVSDHLKQTRTLSVDILNLIIQQGARSFNQTFFELFWTTHMIDPIQTLYLFNILSNVEDKQLLTILIKSLTIENGQKIENITVEYSEEDRAVLIKCIIDQQLEGYNLILEFLTDPKNAESSVKL